MEYNNYIKFILIIFTLVILFILIKYIYYLYMTLKIQKKIVIFDLDETLGHFAELGSFCDVIETYNNKNLNFKEFYNIMELYPEFLRPNIINILLFLKNKKKNHECNKIIIYTNNTGPKRWAEYIKKYFEKKIDYKLFDRIINAYKIGGVQIEPERTSHEKSIDDFFAITGIPQNSKICFIDDQYHDSMNRDSVYYINIKPYTHHLPFKILINRYINNNPKLANKEQFYNYAFNKLKLYDHSSDYKINISDSHQITGKMLLNHINKFFKIFRINNSIKNYKKQRNANNTSFKNKLDS